MSYAEAKEKYAALGVDADRALEALNTIPVSLHRHGEGGPVPGKAMGKHPLAAVSYTHLTLPTKA